VKLSAKVAAFKSIKQHYTPKGQEDITAFFLKMSKYEAEK